MFAVCGVLVSWEYLWSTLRCRRVAGVSPLLSIVWWYLSSVSPKRHCYRVSAADKGCRVYPLDPRSDAVALYSGCTPDSPLTVTPHRTLNSCRGIISKSYLLCASETEILEGFSVTRTSLSPKLPTNIKAGFLNCKVRPYVPNPLRCFKCQRFGHSQTSCRGQLTCSRCASVGHASTDCSL
ncbi:uncharacterized protein TNCV_2134051 [Trichonephila clavipes]|nr:uncharacterized protein TNCV_2134051 [Trichonephila clavipes]